MCCSASVPEDEDPCVGPSPLMLGPKADIAVPIRTRGSLWVGVGPPPPMLISSDALRDSEGATKVLDRRWSSPCGSEGLLKSEAPGMTEVDGCLLRLAELFDLCIPGRLDGCRRSGVFWGPVSPSSPPPPLAAMGGSARSVWKAVICGSDTRDHQLPLEARRKGALWGQFTTRARWTSIALHIPAPVMAPPQRRSA
jgi:hypothetical protein